VIKGDKLTYDQDTDEAHATGNVRLSKSGTLAVGPEARMRVQANEGYMLSPDYYFQQTGGSGSAERVDFLDPDRSTLKKATYTTCSPDNADWYFSARKLDLDSDRQVGTAYGGVLNFFGVPIAGAPAFSFRSMRASQRRAAAVVWIRLELGVRPDCSVLFQPGTEPRSDDLPAYPVVARRAAWRGFPVCGRRLQRTYPRRVPARRQEGGPQPLGLLDPAQSGHHSWMTAYVNVSKVSDDKYPDDLTRSVSQSTLRQYTQEGGVIYAGRTGCSWHGCRSSRRCCPASRPTSASRS
jgi:LPS-assembly protein